MKKKAKTPVTQDLGQLAALAAVYQMVQQEQAAGRDPLAAFKVASTTANLQQMHGPTGTMSRYGLNKDVFNAMVLPELGLLKRLPVMGTTFMNNLHGILTGQKPITGSIETGNCEPCRVAGDLKQGAVTYTFGRTCLSTPTIDTSGDAGALKNRSEFRDFRLIGGAEAMMMGDNSPTMPGSMSDFLNRELDAVLFRTYVAWARDIYSRLIWTGNPVNNSGSYREFRGLDILINTGYQDAETGAWLRAADSLVISFGSQNVATAGNALVNEVTRIMRRLRMTAKQTGMDPVKWVIVMPEMMFYEITAVWPCNYQTYRCVTNANGATVNLDAVQMRNEVEAMREGRYLLVDNMRVEVILDDSIVQTGPTNGTYTAPMYFVPLTVTGGVPATYIEYFDYDNADAMAFRNVFVADEGIVASDGGRFLWNRRKNGFCVSMDMVERSRLILETPFLAARLTNISYTPVIETRSGYPSEGDRFYNGGQSGWPAPSLYPPVVYQA